MSTLILIIIFISILILVHEWGHFYSARYLKIKVEEFGFGFPPKLFSYIKNGVRYSFNALPFGGFVKIFGEHGEGEGERDSFISRPIWQRFVVLFAGVFMNLVLAWVLFSVVAAIGVPRLAETESATEEPVSIVGVSENSPAKAVGLKFGDKILEAKSEEVSLIIKTENDLSEFIDAYRGEEIILAIQRGEEILEKSIVPRGFPPEGEGPMGVALGRITIEKTPFYLAPVEGMKTLANSVILIAQGLGFIIKEIFVRGGAELAVAGPVGIFFLADDTRALGLAYFLQFIGIISVNLAILNVLPIPALDGGRILFLAIEKIKGKRIDQKVENIIHTFGFAFLILLMILVTYKDIVRIF